MTKLHKTTTPPLTNSNCASGRDYVADYKRWKERMERKKVEDPEGYERLRRHTLDKHNEARRKRDAKLRALGIKPNAGVFHRYKEHILAYRKAHSTDWSEVYKRRKEKERLLKEQDPEAYAKIRESRKRSKKKYRGKVRAELAAKGTTEYALNRERIREYQKFYREKNAEKLRKQAKERYDKTHVRVRKFVREMTDAELADRYARKRERDSEYDRTKRDKDKKRRSRMAWNLRRRLAFARDAQAYHRDLENKREYSRRHNDKRRKIPYRPKPSMRIPEHVPFCASELAIDHRSVFIFENRSDQAACMAFDKAQRDENWAKKGGLKKS